MFPFTLAFLQTLDIFLFIFNLFPLFAERGRWNLEESIHNENHRPQLLHVSGVKLIALLALQHTFHLLRKEMHFKVLKKTYEL